MEISTCLLILAIVLGLGLIVAAWEIIEAILHLVFHIVEGCFQWPIVFLIVAAVVAIWIFFLR